VIRFLIHSLSLLCSHHPELVQSTVHDTQQEQLLDQILTQCAALEDDMIKAYTKETKQHLATVSVQ
jgi:hypothetical protein